MGNSNKSSSDVDGALICFMPKLMLLVRDFALRASQSPDARFAQLLQSTGGSTSTDAIALRNHLRALFPAERRRLCTARTPMGGAFDESCLQVLETLKDSDLRPEFLQDIDAAAAAAVEMTEYSRLRNTKSKFSIIIFLL